MIAEAAPRPGPLAVWWIGARPRTLVAAVVPVMVGAAWAGRNAVYQLAARTVGARLAVADA